MSLRNPAKDAQGFESKPPLCFNCVYYAMLRAKNPSQKYPRCTLGDFVTSPHSICDCWRSKNGEVLDLTPNKD